MDARQRLEEMRKQLADGYGAVQTWYFIYGLILFLIAGVMALVIVTELFYGGGEPGGLALSLTMLGALALSVVILVAAERAWHRHYELAWRYLKYTSLAAIVIDEAAWEEVLAQTKGNVALQVTGLSRPRQLDELLELSADYWRYALAVSGGGDERTRRRALVWDNSTRIYNNLVNSLCNGCAAYVILIALAGVLIVVFPLLYIALYFYIQQHAAKSAFVDYFLDRPRVNRSKLKPL